jgi:hypothetical protein
VRLRRTASGDAELIEVNGAAPLNPVFLPEALLPPPTRGGPSIDFGARSVEAEATVVFTEVYSVVVPEPGSLGLMLLGILGLPLIHRRRPQ